MNSEITARILVNIRGDVRGHLRNGTAMPKRDSRWDADILRIMAEEVAVLNEELLETLYRPFYETSGLSSLYSSMEEWMDVANSLYSIVGCVLTSVARGPDHMREYHMESNLACHKKKLQLIGFKKRDHFVRGHGFAYVPPEFRKVGE